MKIAKLSLRTFIFGSWARAGCLCACAGSTNFLLSLARLAGKKSMPFYQFLKEAEVSRQRRAMISWVSLCDRHRAQRRQWPFPGSPYPHFTDGEPKSVWSPCSSFQPANCKLVLAGLPFLPGYQPEALPPTPLQMQMLAVPFWNLLPLKYRPAAPPSELTLIVQCLSSLKIFPVVSQTALYRWSIG